MGTYTYPTQGSSAVRPHAVQTAGVWGFAYDANGNQTGRTASSVTDRTIAWDGDNRPSTVTTPSGTVTYLYSPDGSRLKKIAAAGTTLTIGDDIERDTSGNFSFYPDPDVKLSGGTVSYLHRDHLASVRRITDASGNLTRASVYAPYGQQVETVVATSPAEPKGFTGERTDAEDNLTYLHARFYDPLLGRFLSPDWWDVTEAGVGTNRYAYAGGDPVDGSDRGGHYFLLDDVFVIAAGAALGVVTQAASDLLSGSQPEWQKYSAAAVSGAVGGEAALYTIEAGPLALVAAGAASGAAYDATLQLAHKLSDTPKADLNAESLLDSMVIGAAVGLVPGMEAAGVTAGRNSWMAITKQIATKAKNATISTISPKTAVKMTGAVTFNQMGSVGASIIIPLVLPKADGASKKLPAKTSPCVASDPLQIGC